MMMVQEQERKRESGMAATTTATTSATFGISSSTDKQACRLHDSYYYIDFCFLSVILSIQLAISCVQYCFDFFHTASVKYIHTISYKP